MATSIRPSNKKVYSTAHKRSNIVLWAPGVSFCSPFCTAAIPPEAEITVVMAAKEAMKVVD